MSRRTTPEEALAAGRWVKWIAGASNQDLVAIEDLAGIFALAGVHCIDVAADPAVVAAARRGMAWAQGHGADAPWLMVSLSDGSDPHFRKAWFEASRCPSGCSRPCERVCPALAIPPVSTLGTGPGVLAERCYGCGRCLPACPLGLIEEHDHVLPPEQVASLLARLAPDAVEVHTRPGRAAAFAQRLVQLRASGLPLRRVAVSAGLEGRAGTGSLLAEELWRRFALLRLHGFRPLWQLDGRPMSGDLGVGTAHAAVRLLDELGSAAPPGPLQLAGGTNHHTLKLVERLGGRLGRFRAGVAGVAFGGVARRLVQPLLVEAQHRGQTLLSIEELWGPALSLARELVEPWTGA